jgi:hypothetical protein
VNIDWKGGGWMAPTLNDVITGSWYTYTDKRSSTISPYSPAKITTNCVDGTVSDCAGCWGAGFGFETGGTNTAWKLPPKGICVELDVASDPTVWAEFNMLGFNPHTNGPYGKRLSTGVNILDLDALKPTWGNTTTPFNPASVSSIQIKFALPAAGAFHLCVKAVTTY